MSFPTICTDAGQSDSNCALASAWRPSTHRSQIEVNFSLATLARKFGDRIAVVEPYAAELPKEFDGTAASLIDIDTALETSDILIVLVDHDAFKAVPLAERAHKLVYDTRGIWLDQPRAAASAVSAEPLKLVG